MKAKDTDNSEVVKEELGKQFYTQTWNNGTDSTRAFETSKEPIYIKPNEPPLPTRFVHNTNTDCTIKTEEDPEYESKSHRYKMLTTMFAIYHIEWKDNVKHWKSNNYRMFAILLQNCPKDLTQRLKSNVRYEAVNYSKDVISLITMVHDVYHQHGDTTQGTMALVTNNLALYTTFMTSEDDTEEFYGTFNAMSDTINVHGRSFGYHPQLYNDHLTLLCVERELYQMTISRDELEKV